MRFKRAAGLAAAALLTAVTAVCAPAPAVAAPAPVLVINQENPPVKPIVGVDGYKGGPLSKSAYVSLIDGQAAKSLAAPTGTVWHWQGADQRLGTSNNTGATSLAALVSQHHPKVETGTDGTGSHSLWEMSAESSDQQQVIEIGWTMDASASICNQSTNPCFFVYSWINGAPMGYNASNPGWVDNPNETAVNAGTALASTASGSAPSAFYQYRVERVSSPSWCTSTCGTPAGFGTGWQVIQKNQGATDRIIGGFKDTDWSGAATPATFTNIDYFQLFGEEAIVNGAPSCSDGGSGVFGTSTEPSAAARVVAYSFSGVTGYSNVPDSTFVHDSVNGALSTDSPTAYRLYQLPTDLDQWKYGGPGYDSAGTGTGSIGSC